MTVLSLRIARSKDSNVTGNSILQNVPIANFSLLAPTAFPFPSLNVNFLIDLTGYMLSSLHLGSEEFIHAPRKMARVKCRSRFALMTLNNTETSWLSIPKNRIKGNHAI